MNLFRPVFLGFVIVVSPLLACAEPQEAESEPKSWTEALDRLKKTTGDAFSKAQQTTPEEAMRELKKLGQYEYKVFTISLDGEDTKLEESLNTLGRESWDCFQLLQLGGAKLQVICKRRPDTPFKYLPQNLLR